MFKEKNCFIYGAKVNFNIQLIEKEDISRIGNFDVNFGKKIELKVSADIEINESKSNEFLVIKLPLDDGLNENIMSKVLSELIINVKKRVIRMKKEINCIEYWNGLDLKTLL